MVLVFQYGSNATPARLLGPKRLNGNGRVVGPAETVEEFDIAFDVHSQTNRCAASNLIRTPGHRAWGVLYEVADDFVRGTRPDGQRTLSGIEGPSYEEKEIMVRPPGGEPVKAVTFLVRSERRTAGLWTGAWYVSWIVYGLREQKVPEIYLAHVIQVALEANRQASMAAEEQSKVIATL